MQNVIHKCKIIKNISFNKKNIITISMYLYFYIVFLKRLQNFLYKFLAERRLYCSPLLCLFESCILLLLK